MNAYKRQLINSRRKALRFWRSFYEGHPAGFCRFSDMLSPNAVI